MVDEKDNRIQFPPTLVDFEDDVGTTGQEHDNFPEPGQARFDHMRLFLIGLLANQSSEDDPEEFRTGTIHFKRNVAVEFFRYFNGEEFASIAEGIKLSDDFTLATFFAVAESKLALPPKVTWSGVANEDTDTIPVPTSVQETIAGFEGSISPLVYINGVLVDPRDSSLTSPATTIELTSVQLDDGDKYTVILESFDQFVLDEVVAP